jgi:hypothetical protein
LADTGGGLLGTEDGRLHTINVTPRPRVVGELPVVLHLTNYYSTRLEHPAALREQDQTGAGLNGAVECTAYLPTLLDHEHHDPEASLVLTRNAYTGLLPGRHINPLDLQLRSNVS